MLLAAIRQQKTIFSGERGTSQTQSRILRNTRSEGDQVKGRTNTRDAKKQTRDQNQGGTSICKGNRSHGLSQMIEVSGRGPRKLVTENSTFAGGESRGHGSGQRNADTLDEGNPRVTSR